MLFLFLVVFSCSFLFFFNATATTEIYTLSLHDALPIFALGQIFLQALCLLAPENDPVPLGLFLTLIVPIVPDFRRREVQDRKSTRLNSSHGYISYAVFCLKKKKKIK